MVIALTGSEVRTSALRSLGLAAPFSRDGSHKTMSGASCPPMRKPLVLPTSAFYPVSPPSVLHTWAKQSGGCPSHESSCRPGGRGSHWVMAFSSLAWGPLLLSFSSTGMHWVPMVCQACARRGLPCARPQSRTEDAEVRLFPRRHSAAETCQSQGRLCPPLASTICVLNQKEAVEGGTHHLTPLRL